VPYKAPGPYKASGGLVRPYKALGRSLKFVQDDFKAIFGKFGYDIGPGGPYKAFKDLIRPLGSL
jgi:hypothetical protein